MDRNASRDAFVDHAYRDAHRLLVALRDYVTDDLTAQSNDLAPDDRIALIRELSVLTRRLAEIMGWLMLQRAVIAGEMTAEQAAGHPAAALDDPALAEPAADGAAMARLPIAARGLIDRSRRLIAHVTALAQG